MDDTCNIWQDVGTRTCESLVTVFRTIERAPLFPVEVLLSVLIKIQYFIKNPVVLWLTHILRTYRRYLIQIPVLARATTEPSLRQPFSMSLLLGEKYNIFKFKIPLMWSTPLTLFSLALLLSISFSLSLSLSLLPDNLCAICEDRDGNFQLNLILSYFSRRCKLSIWS